MSIYHKYDDEFLESKWEEFGNISLDDYECIEEDWFGFSKGTHREEIWDWFDKQHTKGVYWLMFERRRNKVKHPVNVYGSTLYYERGEVECVYDGFGYRDSNGNITWYDGYNPPKDDEFHLTTITPYRNGKDLSE